MKKWYKPFKFILFAFILLFHSGCTPQSAFYTDTNIDPSDIETQQSKVSILNLSELEIIKITADYLKAHGEKVVFKETKISYFNNEEPEILCKNDKGENIRYKGKYLEVRYYPNPDPAKGEENECTIVYLAEGNKVLGYSKIEKN